MSNALPLTALAALLTAAVAIVMGVGVGSADYRIVGVCLVLPVAWFVLRNQDRALSIAFVAGLLLVGLSQLYLPQFQYLRWGVAGLVSLVGAVAVAGRLLHRTSFTQNNSDTLLGRLMVAFLLFGLFGSLVSFSGIEQLGYGAKGYFQAWGLFFALALWQGDSKFVAWLPKLFLAIALLQIPFALHQYLYLVPMRAMIGGHVVAEDVVVGTFGASLFAGGANSALSLFLVIAISLVLALYNRDRIGGVTTTVLAGVLLFPIVVNASVVSLFFLVFALIVMFGSSVRAHPMKTMFGGALMVVLIGVVLFGNVNFASRAVQFDSLSEYVVAAVERNVDEDQGYGLYRLNRMTVVPYWWQQQDGLTDVHTWIGHGLGQARQADQSALVDSTLANSVYAGQGIGLTAMAALLWETGLIGFGLVAAIFVAGFIAAGRVVKLVRHDVWQHALAQATRVGIGLAAISLLHKNLFISHLPYQMVVLVMFGYVMYWLQPNRVLSDPLAER